MFLVLSALFFFSAPASARQIKNLPPAPVALEKTAEEFHDYKKKSQDLQEKEREILGAMYKLDRRQRRLAKQKAEQLQKREGLEADIMHLEKSVGEVTEQIKTLKKKLIVRIRNINRVSTPTIFQAIFGSQDITEMDRNARILYKISKSDVDQLRTFRGLKNLLDQQQADLEQKLAEFEKTQKNLDKQENAIKTTYLAQTTLLHRLDNQDRVIVNKLKKIKKRAGVLTKNSGGDMETLFEAGLYEKRGSLEMPVNGVVTKKFGLLQLLQDKIRIYNKGWFISTAPSREVNTVYKGRVIYTGTMDEYNRVVIIDHGDHFYSVYANLQNSSVNVGDEVGTQETLGRVTQSRLFGNGLYFEIRHFSQSEDPSEWFKDKGINLSSKEQI